METVAVQSTRVSPETNGNLTQLWYEHMEAACRARPRLLSDIDGLVEVGLEAMIRAHPDILLQVSVEALKSRSRRIAADFPHYLAAQNY